MSEHQSLPASSDSPEPSISAQAENWETAPIPGTVDTVQDSVQLSTDAIASERERELLALIHDLNQCNDVLLSRVTQLESALEKSQSAQAVSAQTVSAQAASTQTAQQQVAKLVDELDNTEQALSRQVLINENLQTEVNNYQERISQLERECTIVAQQHLAEVQGRAKAEADSKDLRSRLQRQQRYTMQFKAALEKSLTVTAKPSSSAIQPVAFNDSAAVVMPKAQRIMPWVSNSSSSFAGIDPHLESLIRGVGQSGARSEAATGASLETANANAEKAIASQDADKAAASKMPKSVVEPDMGCEANLEAKDKLWQDIERVTSHAEREGDVVVDQKPADILKDAEISLQFDDKAEVGESAPLESSSKPNDSKVDDLIPQIERSFAKVSRQAPEESVAFTEPSPWGTPSLEEELEPQVDQKLERMAATPSRQLIHADNSYLPVVDSQTGSAVSPVVKPLRVSARKAAPTSKKSGSLSDIELPTFQNAKVASFRS